MPPRKSSVRAKKLTPKAKQQDVESSTPMDANSTLLDSEIKVQESEKDTINQQEVEEAAHPVDEEEEMKPDIGVLNGNHVAVEGLTSGGEDRVLVSTEVEVTVKEESTTYVLMEDSLNVITVDLAEKGEDATEKGIVEGGQNEGGVIGNDSSQPGIASVAEMNSPEEETVAAQVNDTEGLGNSTNLLVVNEGSNQQGEGDESGADDDSEDNKDEDSSVLIHDPLIATNKLEDLEIFIGGLDKGAVEDDLIEVFGKFGEIKAARIARKSSTKKSKGFAFIQYATVEQAMNALSELKDGIEVRGKHVRVSISQDKDTLYMGNICKTWTKEQVLETLKLYGIEHIEEIQLPDDPGNEGRIKGFALLNFSTHSNALEAFQRLRKPDAVFGRDRSAKVTFTQTSMHPNEEDLSQVKRVYVEGLTDAWNKEKVEEICKQYGEIVEVKLFRNKRKYFGFVSFTSRESALACVEGINNAQIGEGEVKLKSNIAKPQHKDRLQKKGFSGRSMVQKTNKASPSKRESEAKQAGPSKAKGHAKSKRAKGKGKTVAEEKGKALSESKNVDGRKPNKPQSGTESQTVGTTSKSETPSRKRKNLPSKGEGRSHGGIERGNSKRPSKKRRGNVRERQSNNFRKPERDDRRKDGSSSTAYYQGHAHGVISASKRHRTDMEPHAGYLEPVAGKQVQPYSGYLQPAVGIQSQPYARYREPTVWTQAQTRSGYLEPSVGIQGQPHAGYIQPAVVKYVHDPYDPRLRRDDGQGSSGYAYGASSTLPPYAPNYTTYAGYEGQGAAGYYQSSGAYALPRRAYY